MNTLSILPKTPPPCLPKTSRWPPSTTPCHPQLLPPSHTWRLHGSAKGFTPTTRKDREPLPPTGKSKNEKNYNNRSGDEKIPDVVWERMIQRILFLVGVPLVIGLALLQAISVAQEQGLWDVPKWVPFLTTFITFGTSTIGIAYGSLSTSLDAAEEGSFWGFEQVEKNWTEMWKEEDESGD